MGGGQGEGRVAVWGRDARSRALDHTLENSNHPRTTPLPRPTMLSTLKSCWAEALPLFLLSMPTPLKPRTLTHAP